MSAHVWEEENARMARWWSVYDGTHTFDRKWNSKLATRCWCKWEENADPFSLIEILKDNTTHDIKTTQANLNHKIENVVISVPGCDTS